jgi:hypothetical protein
MELKALGVGGKKRAAKADLPQTLVVRLSDIKLEQGKAGLFNGINEDTKEPVTVRLMTVEEGVLVNKRQDESFEQAKARLEKSYVGAGDAHRPRPAEIANPNAKVHCGPGGLLMFTKAMQNADGTFRAHWAETLEGKPGAVCEKVMANVKIGQIFDREDRSKVTGEYVYADVIKPQFAAVLNKDNAELVLQAAFANSDGDLRRNPFVLARLVGVEDGKVYEGLPELQVRGATIKEKAFDPDSGVGKDVSRPADAAETIAWINNPENKFRDAMILRAALHGALGKDGYADFGDATEDAKADLNQITDAVRDGSYHFEVIPGERINAGPSTKTSLLKAFIGNDKHPLNMYSGRHFVDNGDGPRQERRVRNFFDTYLTIKEGEGGYRYFTKVAAAEARPQKMNLYTIATANDFKTPALEAQRRAAEAGAGVVDADEEEFDPNALAGGVDGKGVDAQLNASAAALEMQ